MSVKFAELDQHHYRMGIGQHGCFQQGTCIGSRSQSQDAAVADDCHSLYTGVLVALDSRGTVRLHCRRRDFAGCRLVVGAVREGCHGPQRSHSILWADLKVFQQAVAWGYEPHQNAASVTSGKLDHHDWMAVRTRRLHGT